MSRSSRRPALSPSRLAALASIGLAAALVAGPAVAQKPLQGHVSAYGGARYGSATVPGFGSDGPISVTIQNSGSGDGSGNRFVSSTVAAGGGRWQGAHIEGYVKRNYYGDQQDAFQVTKLVESGGKSHGFSDFYIRLRLNE